MKLKLIRFFLLPAAISILGLSQASESFGQSEDGTLTINIIQKGSKDVAAAWIHIQTTSNENVNGWYKRGIVGFPVLGSATIKIPYGKVVVTAWNSSCSEEKREIVVSRDTPAVCILSLTPRFDVHKRGYFSFEGHDHMDGESEMNKPPFIYPYCAALGIDHLSVCQLWFHTIEKPVSYDSIMKYLSVHSNERLSLSFGAESPKLRFGHTWTVNHPGLKDPLGDYLKWHDVSYFKIQVATDTFRATMKDLREKLHPVWQPPFVDRLRNNSKGAFSAAAHPTRWWHNAANEVFPGTNLAADLAFDLLVAQSYQGLSVIGELKDNIPYQNLWFTLLNQGYRLTPVTESDGDVAKGNLGSKGLTYVWTGKNNFDLSSLTTGLKAGHTLLSGKAIMFLTVDGDLPPGSVLSANGKSHTVEVEVFSEPYNDEYVSFLVLYRNGRVMEKRDYRKKNTQHIKTKFRIKENETAWYVVKSYGKVYPKEELQFDVMAYANRCLNEPDNDYARNSGISMTAPVYFNTPGWKAPAPLISQIHAQLLDKNGKPLVAWPIEVWNVDKKLADLKTDDEGRFGIDAPATIDVRFTLPDGQKEQQWLFYEYPPLLDLIEDTYTINWAKDYPNIKGGHVPWKAFHYDEVKEVLKVVQWSIRPAGRRYVSNFTN